MCYLPNRIFCALGGLLGAGGIAAYAAASHLTGSHYSALAPILLGNASLLVMLGLSKIQCVIAWMAGLLISLGAVLFGSDLMLFQSAERHLFPYAAPLGGITIILGWLTFIIIAFLPIHENTP